MLKNERERERAKAVFDVRVAVDAGAPVPSQSPQRLSDSLTLFATIVLIYWH